MPELVVFLNKVDLLGEGDAELQELVEMEVRRQSGAGFEAPCECTALSWYQQYNDSPVSKGRAKWIVFVGALMFCSLETTGLLAEIRCTLNSEPEIPRAMLCCWLLLPYPATRCEPCKFVESAACYSESFLRRGGSCPRPYSVMRVVEDTVVRCGICKFYMAVFNFLLAIYFDTADRPRQKISIPLVFVAR